MKKNHNNRAFTLVETLVGFALATALIILVMQLGRITRASVAKGDVDLQNLQEARSAINSLRRDFLVATPLYNTSDGLDIREEIRNNPVLTSDRFSKQQKSRPVIVSDQEIHFCRYTLDQNGNKTIEEISYVFDKTDKSLIRTTLSGKKVFTGIENARFSVYSHSLDPRVPLLWVALTVENKESGESKKLELATTIASSIISQDLNNSHWNWTSQ
ncbi:MAG: type II secretion system GspH family protein [Candidatus Riflebacteria bacterium]|nr:type II secretion system GspH family protein [Candidatus Riflebacteria bacterium]